MKYRNICKYISMFGVCLIFSSLNVLKAQDPIEIIKKVYSLSDGDNRKNTTTIIKTNKRGRTREEKILSYSKDEESTVKTLMYTLAPADVEGVRFLSWEYNNEDKDDDRWLYLPAMKKIRRISSSSSKSEYFFGTDFTYDDLSKKDINDDTFKFLKEETVDGQSCWLLELVPIDKKIMYSKKIVWIRKDINLVVKIEFYDKMNALLKTLINSEIEQIDNIWTCKNMKMVNHQTNHETVLKLDDVSYNIQLNDYLFTVPALEEGRIN